MNERLKQTIKLVRRSKLGTDERGRSVWTGEVDTCELELVSTTELQRIIASSDDEQKERLREAASGKDGVLAHDVENDQFEIIDDEDLKAALDSAAGATADDRKADVTYEPADSSADIDELSLVSTQALRRILEHEVEVEDDLDEPQDQGFDPYNSG